MIACMTMALAGFLTFGIKTQGNVLNNFPTDNILVNVARLYAVRFFFLKIRADQSQLFWPEHAYYPPPRSLRLPRSHDQLLVPRRIVEPESASYLHYFPRRHRHDVVSAHLRPGRRVRADWRHKRLRPSIYTAAPLLHPAEYEELEVDSGDYVCGVRRRRDGHQPRTSCGENYPE